ncbi:MAG: hypothetical protein UV74_C0013G0169 [Candidatus Woesebacteria bacterium GW2011_GWB1_43_14]|uniref:Fimbrial assembly family protein n=1 Tax=Candidatus Woesebacteria bacterium GW2011_GWB1_43_14 TaxID=1618578 RepID=A0A0G1DHH9_9BACT|nr:MAG: hypothetical protein UV51_C0005G0052 [Candidatus Woesebacteria bacterium GW2011_GWC1_42_9]KKS97047.1 MAG: hypothetical protein UV74_C0013G0169 [Candidatus Woesebacteria bacterium GW2011_GWB1_43_14]
MPRKIDLLPSELRADTKVVGYARNLRLVAMIVVVGSFFIFLGGVLALYLRSRTLSELETERKALENEVTNLEATEQQLVLVRDRIQKIKEVLDSRNNEELITNQAQLVNSFSEGLKFESAEIDPENSQLGVIAVSSREMSNLFDKLSSNRVFQAIVVEELGFSPVLGYQFYLNMR